MTRRTRQDDRDVGLRAAMQYTQMQKLAASDGAIAVRLVVNAVIRAVNEQRNYDDMIDQVGNALEFDARLAVDGTGI